MSRYIDADKLIEDLKSCSYDTWSKDINRAWWAQAVKVKDNIVNCIKNTPTADVVEVRHGHWIDVSTNTLYRFKCSLCGKERLGIQTDYCCHCGARMDGERKEANEG